MDRTALDVWQAEYPRLVGYARKFFHGRCRGPEEHEERVAEAIALAWAEFARLVGLKRDCSLLLRSVIALACKRVKVGRTLAGRWRTTDVLAEAAQECRGFTVQSIPQFETLGTTELTRALATSRGMDPAEIAPARIDYGQWCQGLTHRQEAIAHHLAQGATAKEAADVFGMDPATVRWYRRELRESWEAFSA